MLCQVEGTTTIIMIKPEGSRVKEGEVVAELDSASLKDLLINQRIATQQAEASFKQARLVREVAEYASREYLEGILPQERQTWGGKVEQSQSAIKKALQDRLERTKLASQRLSEVRSQTERRPPTSRPSSRSMTASTRPN